MIYLVSCASLPAEFFHAYYYSYFQPHAVAEKKLASENSFLVYDSMTTHARFKQKACRMYLEACRMFRAQTCRRQSACVGMETFTENEFLASQSRTRVTENGCKATYDSHILRLPGKVEPEASSRDVLSLVAAWFLHRWKGNPL